MSPGNDLFLLADLTVSLFSPEIKDGEYFLTRETLIK